MLTLTFGSISVLFVGATITLFDTVDPFWLVLALMVIGSAWTVYGLGVIVHGLCEWSDHRISRYFAPMEPIDVTGAEGPEDSPIGKRDILGV